jgi:hypothetical protein
MVVNSNMEDKFRDAIFHEDHIGKVIKTHIHVENLVNEYLAVSIKHNEYLKPIQLDYFGRVHLAVATGLTNELLTPLKFIGKLRNSFSHKLEQELTQEVLNNFFDSFTKPHKKEITELASKPSFSWVQDGETWENTTIHNRFMVLCLHLYYELKIELVRLEHHKNL